MLEICFGTYLVLGLPAVLFLWTALTASKMNRESDQQRYYKIAMAVSRIKQPRGGYDLLEDAASL